MEIDATISILTKLQQWSQIVGDIESALEQNQLGFVRQSLSTLNNLVSSLEQQTRMVAILPKMVARRDLLTVSIKDAFAAHWDRMISIEANEEGTALIVIEDVNGKIHPSCS